MQSNRLLRAKEAAELLDIGKTKFYELTKVPGFPARITISRLMIGWSEEELINWKKTNIFNKSN